MCHPRIGGHDSWVGLGFGFHPFGLFCCDPPTKEEKIAFLEAMKKRLSTSIERLDDRISKLKAEELESES